MKTCKKCGETKSLDMFTALHTASDGRRSTCKSCAAAEARLKRKANPIKVARERETNRAWRLKNRDHVRSKNKEWVACNHQRVRENWANWAKANKAKVSANNRRQQSHVARVVTKWDPEWDQLVELEAYDLAIARTLLTGVPWEVDHIVPLRSKSVTGLHNGHNLAVITRAHNRAKRNAIWPDMP